MKNPTSNKFSMLKGKHLSDPRLNFKTVLFNSYALPTGPSKSLQAPSHSNEFIPDNFYFPFFGENYDKLR